MKNKLIIFLGLMGIVIPLNAKALTANVILKCDKSTLNSNEQTSCSIYGNVSGLVSSLSIKVKAGENLTISDIKSDSIWEGNGADGDIELYTDNNKTGNFNIATFKVKAGNVNTGVNTSITLDDIILYDAEFEGNSVEKKVYNIKILSASNTPSGGSTTTDDKPINTPSDGNTTTDDKPINTPSDGNTTTDDKPINTPSDGSTTTDDKTSQDDESTNNPKTGLFINIGAISLIGITSISLYFLLRKKNFLSKI